MVDAGAVMPVCRLRLPQGRRPQLTAERVRHLLNNEGVARAGGRALPVCSWGALRRIRATMKPLQACSRSPTQVSLSGGSINESVGAVRSFR
jgi:hypothetical protein